MVSLEIASADDKVWRRFVLAGQRRSSNNYRLTVDWDNLLWFLTLFTGNGWRPNAVPADHCVEPLIVDRELVGWQFPSAELGIVCSELETSLVSSYRDWQSLGLQQGDWLYVGEGDSSFIKNNGGFARINTIDKQRVVLDLCSWLPLTEKFNHNARVFVGRTLCVNQDERRTVCLKKSGGDGRLSRSVEGLSLEIPCHGQLIAELGIGNYRAMTCSQIEHLEGLSSSDIVDSAYLCSPYGSLSIKDLVINRGRQGITGMVRLSSTIRLPSNTRGGIVYTLRFAKSAVVLDLPTVTIGEQYHEDNLYQFVVDNSSMIVVHFPYLQSTG